VLGATQEHGAARHAFDPRFEAAPLGEEADGGVVFPAEAKHGGREIDVGAEHEDGLEIVHGQRELELSVLLNADGQTVTMYGKPRREEIERIVERLSHRSYCPTRKGRGACGLATPHSDEGKIGENQAGTRGLRVRRRGKREKSRSAVQSSRTPWCRQRAAMRASWMRGPVMPAPARRRVSSLQ
jgi:hypothetical protein